MRFRGRGKNEQGHPEDMEHREWGPRGESRVEGALEIPNLGPQEGRFNQGGVGAELGLVWFAVYPLPTPPLHISCRSLVTGPWSAALPPRLLGRLQKTGSYALKKNHDSACIPHA